MRADPKNSNYVYQDAYPKRQIGETMGKIGTITTADKERED